VHTKADCASGSARNGSTSVARKMANIQSAELQENSVAMRSVFQQQRLVQCLQQRRRVQFLESALRSEQQAARANPLEEVERLRCEYQQRHGNDLRR